MNIANLITILRFPLLIIVVLLMNYAGRAGALISAPLIVVLILMDSLDGAVARHRNESTMVGSVLDIAADRAVEIALWVAYSNLGVIPVVVPLTFIVRGALTDSIRSAALQMGQTPHSMMTGKVGHWIVASPVMRSSYAVVKAVAFTTLAIWVGVKGGEGWLPGAAKAVALSATWLSLAICIVRGAPVLVEMPHLFRAGELAPIPESGEEDQA